MFIKIIHMGRLAYSISIIEHIVSIYIQCILFNSMGSWYMTLSDYMGGRCLWKFNSMGGGVKIKVPSSPSRYFFFFE